MSEGSNGMYYHFNNGRACENYNDVCCMTRGTSVDQKMMMEQQQQQVFVCSAASSIAPPHHEPTKSSSRKPVEPRTGGMVGVRVRVRVS